MSGGFPSPCIEISARPAQSRAMNTSWTTIVIAALTTVGAAAAQDNRTLTVVVLDYAGLSDSSMNELESLSTLLLSRAGIRTQWVHCLGHAQGPRPEVCGATLEKGTVMIRILATHPGRRRTLGDPLGAAMVEDGYASIYASEIRRYEDLHGLSAGSVMAYAVTHEIGHLLLGEKHAASGIMRGVWGTSEYRDMAHCFLGFSAAERQALLQAVSTPVGGKQSNSGMDQ